MSAMLETKRDVSASLDRRLKALRSSSQTEKPAVLVVDDNEDIRFLIRYLLEQRGCRVLEAGDGLEAVESAHSFQPDLILMDLSLPGLDGLGAFSLIRDQTELRDTRVIAISGHVAAEEIAATRAAGFDDYLIKPIDLKELDQVLVKHLSQKKSVGFGEAQ
jgi:CheY-like chemotaxis protein